MWCGAYSVVREGGLLFVPLCVLTENIISISYILDSTTVTNICSRIYIYVYYECESFVCNMMQISTFSVLQKIATNGCVEKCTCFVRSNLIQACVRGVERDSYTKQQQGTW